MAPAFLFTAKYLGEYLPMQQSGDDDMEIAADTEVFWSEVGMVDLVRKEGQIKEGKRKAANQKECQLFI